MRSKLPTAQQHQEGYFYLILFSSVRRFPPRHFALITRKVFHDLRVYNGLHNMKFMDTLVLQKCVGRIVLLSIENPKEGFRLRVVKHDELNLVRKRKGVEYGNLLGENRRNGYVFDNVTISSPHQEPGCQLSFWLEDKELHPVSVTTDYCDVIQAAFGKGYGGRSRCSSLGTNIFLGQRTSSMASASSATSAENAPFSQYFKQNYEALFRPEIERNVGKLSFAASNFGRRGDPIQSFFLSGKGALTPCCVSLVTLGSTLHTTPGHRVIAYCNESHIDSCDAVSTERHDELVTELSHTRAILTDETLQTNERETWRYARGCLDYIQRFDDRFGWSVYTTCAYQHVFKEEQEKEDSDLYQFFLMDGLGFCARITDHIGHSFYASTFVHRSSICLRVMDGKCFFLCDDGSCSIFAWGEGNSGRNRSTRGVNKTDSVVEDLQQANTNENPRMEVAMDIEETDETMVEMPVVHNAQQDNAKDNSRMDVLPGAEETNVNISDIDPHTSMQDLNSQLVNVDAALAALNNSNGISGKATGQSVKERGVFMSTANGTASVPDANDTTTNMPKLRKEKEVSQEGKVPNRVVITLCTDSSDDDSVSVIVKESSNDTKTANKLTSKNAWSSDEDSEGDEGPVPNETSPNTNTDHTTGEMNYFARVPDYVSALEGNSYYEHEYWDTVVITHQVADLLWKKYTQFFEPPMGMRGYSTEEAAFVWQYLDFQVMLARCHATQGDRNRLTGLGYESFYEVINKFGEILNIKGMDRMTLRKIRSFSLQCFTHFMEDPPDTFGAEWLRNSFSGTLMRTSETGKTFLFGDGKDKDCLLNWIGFFSKRILRMDKHHEVDTPVGKAALLKHKDIVDLLEYYCSLMDKDESYTPPVVEIQNFVTKSTLSLVCARMAALGELFWGGHGNPINCPTCRQKIHSTEDFGECNACHRSAHQSRCLRLGYCGHCLPPIQNGALRKRVQPPAIPGNNKDTCLDIYMDMCEPCGYHRKARAVPVVTKALPVAAKKFDWLKNKRNQLGVPQAGSGKPSTNNAGLSTSSVAVGERSTDGMTTTGLSPRYPKNPTSKSQQTEVASRGVESSVDINDPNDPNKKPAARRIGEPILTKSKRTLPTRTAKETSDHLHGLNKKPAARASREAVRQSTTMKIPQTQTTQQKLALSVKNNGIATQRKSKIGPVLDDAVVAAKNKKSVARQQKLVLAVKKKVAPVCDDKEKPRKPKRKVSETTFPAPVVLGKSVGRSVQSFQEIFIEADTMTHPQIYRGDPILTLPREFGGGRIPDAVAVDIRGLGRTSPQTPVSFHRGTNIPDAVAVTTRGSGTTPRQIPSTVCIDLMDSDEDDGNEHPIQLDITPIPEPEEPLDADNGGGTPKKGLLFVGGLPTEKFCRTMFKNFCMRYNIGYGASSVMFTPDSGLAEADEQDVFLYFNIPSTYKILDVTGDGNCFIYATCLILGMQKSKKVFPDLRVQPRKPLTALHYAVKFRCDMMKYITKAKIVELRQQTEMFMMNFSLSATDGGPSEDEFIEDLQEALASWGGMPPHDFELGRPVNKRALVTKLTRLEEQLKKDGGAGVSEIDKLCFLDTLNFVYVFDRYLKKDHPVRLVVISNDPNEKTIRVCETTGKNTWRAYHVPASSLFTELQDVRKTYVVVGNDVHFTLLVGPTLHSTG